MEQAFEVLRESISQPGERVETDPDDMRRFAETCVVALPVGGFGSRMRVMLNESDVNKNAMRLTTGETMLGLTIELYRAAGIHNFVALVSHQAESVMEVLGDGSDLGVRITYSADPGGPVGRGGAIRHALENGSIPRDFSLIVHNPDDVIHDYPGSFPTDLVAAHLDGLGRGHVATVVLAEGLPATYTGVRTERGVVREIMPYPALPVPAHVGITLFSSSVYEYFDSLFDYSKKTDFESVLFPHLVSDAKLYSFFVPVTCWLQVNDPKSLAALNAALAERSSAMRRD